MEVEGIEGMSSAITWIRVSPKTRQEWYKGWCEVRDDGEEKELVLVFRV